MRIKDCEIKEETVIEIVKFAVLWNEFENTFCGNSCNYKKLKMAAPHVRIDDRQQKELAEVFAYRSRLGEMLLADYVKTGLYPHNAKRPQTEEEERQAMEAFIKRQEGDQTLGCLMAIYRIRCNMMHGLKGIEELDGQYALFKAANYVLENASIKE